MEIIKSFPRYAAEGQADDKGEKKPDLGPEGGWKQTVAEKIKEYTNEDSRLGKMAQAAVNRVDRLSKSDKLSWAEGMANMGYRIKEKKAEALSGIYHGLSGATQGSRFFSTFFGKHAGLYAEERERAEKARTGEKKDLSRLSGIGQGAGTLLRYGRMLYDAGLANPFRHVMAASMFIGKQSEALKETRFEYEGAKENTRVNEVDRAMEEAWDLYEAAVAKTQAGGIKAEDLEKAYRENLPKDISERFARTDYAGLSFIQKGMQRHLKWAADRLTGKLAAIEGSDLPAEEKERQKAALTERNKKLLNDLDAIVGDNATIDTIAYAARAAEKTGKAVSTALMIESIPRFAKLAAKLGGSLWENLGPGEARAAELSTEAGPPFAERLARAEKYGDTIDPRREDVFADKGLMGKAGIPGADNTVFKDQAQSEASLRSIGAITQKGEGVEHAFKRQLLAGPAKFGFKGDVNDKLATEEWAGREAHRIALKNGYVDRQTGHEVRLRANAINRTAYVLKPGENGQTAGVDEMVKGQDNIFYKEESHRAYGEGEHFEPRTRDGLEDHEYESAKPPAVEDIPSGKTLTEDIPSGGRIEIADIPVPGADSLPNEEMYERFGRGLFNTRKQFSAEWPALKDMPARSALAADVSHWSNRDAFADHLGATRPAGARSINPYSAADLEGMDEAQRRRIMAPDWAELENRQRMKDLLVRAQAEIGSPSDRETVGQYLERYYAREKIGNINKEFGKAERVLADSGLASPEASLTRLGEASKDGSLALVGIDRDRDGIIDAIALMRSGDEYANDPSRAYDLVEPGPGEDFDAFRRRAAGHFELIVKERSDKLLPYGLKPEQALAIGVDPFARDGFSPLEEAKLRYAGQGGFDAKRAKEVFGLAERYGFDLADKRPEEIRAVYGHVGQVLATSADRTLNPNQSLAVKEMFFKDPKPGKESVAVLKRLFGHGFYGELGIKEADITPDRRGAAVLSLDQYKIVIEADGRMMVIEPREERQEWQGLNNHTINALYKALKPSRN